MTNTDSNTITTSGITTSGLTETIDRHLEAYASADADRRDQLVASGWSADGALIDPPLAGRGHAEIAALADVVVTHYAGHTFRRTTAVDIHHEFARYGWDLVGPDGTIAVSGTDFVEFDSDGKLLRIVGFFGALAAE